MGKGRFFFFFLSGFSFTDTDNSQDSRGREGTFFIPLYHFRLLTNIQTFMCNFAREMTIKRRCVVSRMIFYLVSIIRVSILSILPLSYFFSFWCTKYGCISSTYYIWSKMFFLGLRYVYSPLLTDLKSYPRGSLSHTSERHWERQTLLYQDLPS